MAELAMRVETHDHHGVNAAGEHEAYFDVAVVGVVSQRDELPPVSNGGKRGIGGDKGVFLSINAHRGDINRAPDFDVLGTIITDISEEGGMEVVNPVEESAIREAVERLLTADEKKEIAIFVGVRAVGLALEEIDRIVTSENLSTARAIYVRAVINRALAQINPEASEALGQLFIVAPSIDKPQKTDPPIPF